MRRDARQSGVRRADFEVEKDSRGSRVKPVQRGAVAFDGRGIGVDEGGRRADRVFGDEHRAC